MPRKSLHVVVVSGMSGSGKSSAIRVLEDLGFYCIDNLPVSLVASFLELCEDLREGVNRVALGIDVRERTFFHGLLGVVDEVRRQGHKVDVLFLDAADDVLVRRFSETRRPHPLAQGGVPLDGIRRERGQLEAIRAGADRILDTTALTVHELRDVLREAFDEPSADGTRCRITIVSFGFKFGIPSDTDMILDVRFLPNPFFVSELRGFSGLDEAVVRFLMDRKETVEFLERSAGLLRFLLPLYEKEGKSYFTLGVGCTGGRHRSVVLAGQIMEALAAEEYRVQIRHRDLER